MLGGQLERIQNPQYFVEVSTGTHGIGEHEFDFLVRSDDEYRAHGCVIHRRTALRAPFRACRKHVVELRDLHVRVADEWVVGCVTLSLFDVFRPLLVIAGGIDAQTHYLAITFVELRLESCHITELGGAHRGEILGVGK